MAQIILPIRVEVAKPNFFQAIVAKQYDNDSRWLQVTLVHEKEKIEVSSDSTVLINAKRNDGEEKSFLGSINNDGKLLAPLTSWMLELAGTLECDISVIDKEEKKLTSTKFTVEVERASCSDQSITEDEDYDILIKLLSDVSQAKSDATSAINEATTAATAANTAASNAAKAADNASEAISNLSTALKNTSEAINRADIAAYQASNAAETANAAATKATDDVADALQVLNPIKEEAILAVDNAHSKAQEAASAASSAREAATKATNAATAAETATSAANTATSNATAAANQASELVDYAMTEVLEATANANEAKSNANDAATKANNAANNANTAAALARGAAESANKAAGLPFYVYATAGFLSNNTVSFEDPIGLIEAITTAYQSGRQVILIANANIDYDLPKVPLIMPMKFIVSNMMAVFSVMWQKKSYEITILGESYVANKYEF